MIERRTRKLIAGLIMVFGAICAAVLGLGAGTAAAAPHNWEEVAQCESGGDWTTNTGNGFFGGLQFHPETWRSHGGEGLASEASKAEQILVAERVLKTQGPGAWPVCGQYLTLAEPGESESVWGSSDGTGSDETDVIARTALAGARELAAERASSLVSEG
ncbi:MAG: transglycosylase family protein [Rhodococcus sp.]|nr:transglycosylase family protein [Rhodococcus sp. (in: high G+C Gram-positive bacteria)]